MDGSLSRSRFCPCNLAIVNDMTDASFKLTQSQMIWHGIWKCLHFCQFFIEKLEGVFIRGGVFITDNTVGPVVLQSRRKLCKKMFKKTTTKTVRQITVNLHP